MSSRTQGRAGNTPDLASLLTQAVSALQSGDLPAARLLAGQALELSPNTAACHLVGATAFQNSGDADRAEHHLLECLRLEPGNVRAHTNLGLLLLNAERGDEAVQYLERAVALEPAALDARHYLARAYGLCGHYDLSIEQFRIVEQKVPDNPDVLKGLAKSLAEAGQHEASTEILKRVIAIRPDDAVVCRELGVNHAASGDFDAAESWLRDAVRLAPVATDAYLQLEQIRRFGEADAAAIEATLETMGANPRPEEAACLFALGSFFDRNGSPDRAFDAIERANSIMDARSRLDLDFIAELYRRAGDATDRAVLRGRPGGSMSDQPVFIVGMPRSGTTLVEQILAAHPSVFAAGERRTIMEMAAELRDDSEDGYIDIGALDADELRHLASQYLGQLPADASGALRVTDKLPNNTSNLPLIARMFPNARIILCRRHPMAVAWSIFKGSFSEKISYATNLNNIASIQKIICPYMDLWASEMGDCSLEVAYEGLIDDFETVARRIISFCGLEWDDACLHPDAVRRSVHTASLWQVRQPIYKSSVGEWRRYGPHLADIEAEMAPLISAYQRRFDLTESP